MKCAKKLWAWQPRVRILFLQDGQGQGSPTNPNGAEAGGLFIQGLALWHRGKGSMKILAFTGPAYGSTHLYISSGGSQRWSPFHPDLR